MRRLATSLALMGAFAGSPALAMALPPEAGQSNRTVISAEAGDLRLEVSYEIRDGRESDPRVKIIEGGVVVLDKPPPCAPRQCRPVPTFGGKKRAAIVRDVDGDGSMDAVAEFLTAGANTCCSISAIYTKQSAGGYALASRTWDPFHRLKQLDGGGPVEFVTGDGRFLRFGCNACTPRPDRIFVIEDGRLVNRTRADRYRSIHANRARNLRRRFIRGRSDPASAKAIMPAYIATACLAGRRLCRQALLTLRSAARRQRFRREPFALAPSGRAYVRTVMRVLGRAGYLRFR